jgi:hypothetical protein
MRLKPNLLTLDADLACAVSQICYSVEVKQETQMTQMIHYNDVTEAEVHLFTAEASSLGLRAGEWPQNLETKIGNQRPFIRTSKKVDAEGGLLWVTYRQDLGCVVLRIFND